MSSERLTLDDIIPDPCPTCGERRWRDEIKHGLFYTPRFHTVTWLPSGDRVDTCPAEYRS